MAGRAGAVLLTTLLLGTACASGEKAGTTDPSATPETLSGPQTYRVNMDGPSSPEDNFVFAAYFPGTIKARPGDTIVFDNLSSHDIHTVTFGVKADRSNAPKPETPAVQANPAVFGPCFADAGADPAWQACPVPPGPAGQGGPPAFSGTGYWNSGVVLPRLLAGDEAPSEAEVTLADGIAAGAYPIVCLLHPFMNGELQVVVGDAERLSPSAVTEAAGKEFEDARAGSESVQKPAVEVPGATAVLAGWGDEVVAADVFAPATVKVKAGDTVTWTSESPYMPHTVSFEAPFSAPSAPDALRPAGTRSGAAYEEGTAHSGIIGPPPYPTKTFSLRFRKPGTYPYVCILHPRMTGTVEVAAE
ncbi:MAG: cupredoxin domain-containing protein [Actinomycetota bacterium]